MNRYALLPRLGTDLVPCMSGLPGRSLLAVLACTALIAACTMGPEYVRPQTETPPTFKEEKGWKAAQPRDHELRSDWWEAFGDPLLSDLQRRVAISNQNLAQAEAQFRQARALVQSARAGFFPSVSGIALAERARASSSGATTTRGARSNYSPALDAVWELDLWGRVRRGVEANEAGAQASAADLAALRLSVQSELAQNYFQLRSLDTQKRLLEDSVAAYQKSLQLTQNQYAAGIVSRADVVQAQTQVKSTQAQALDVGVQRAQLEHAIALLIGKPASSFSIPYALLMAEPPSVPVGLPSALLERRPDIAAAERRVSAANARIGVARAAYFLSKRRIPEFRAIGLDFCAEPLLVARTNVGTNLIRRGRAACPHRSSHSPIRRRCRGLPPERLDRLQGS
jgi:NodT family efflux transporter outer membrane factor (OMF) lipoprotein